MIDAMQQNTTGKMRLLIRYTNACYRRRGPARKVLRGNPERMPSH